MNIYTVSFWISKDGSVHKELPLSRPRRSEEDARGWVNKRTPVDTIMTDLHGAGQWIRTVWIEHDSGEVEIL